MMFAWLPVLVALAQASASAGSTQAAPSGQAAGNAGSADAGKRLFMKNTCYFCHGTAGQGGVAGVRIAAVARNAQGFIRYVRRPAVWR
jgi:cytochrome c